MEEQKFELDLRMSDQGIVCNAQSLKEMLPSKLKPYNYLVNVDNYDVAKKDRTKLNNLVKVLETKRKQFEDNELSEWISAKKILMSIEKEIKSVAESLGDGVKAIDEDEKLAKMERIRSNFEALELPLNISFEQLYDRKKYDPKSKTDKAIMEEMQTKINKIIEDSKMMKLFLPDDLVEQEQIKSVYCVTLELGKAKEKADELAKLHQQVEEKRSETIEQQTEKEVTQQTAVVADEQLYTRTFTVVNCTRQQIIDLGNYMNANGIKFKKVEGK